MENGFWALILGETKSPFVLTVLLVMGIGLTLSKRAAEISGPLGAAARWWRNREVRRIEQAQAVWRAHQKVADEQTDARIADLLEQIEYLKGELAQVRARAQANSEILGSINRTVGTVSAKLDHPSRLGAPLPAPRKEVDLDKVKILTY